MLSVSRVFRRQGVDFCADSARSARHGSKRLAPVLLLLSANACRNSIDSPDHPLFKFTTRSTVQKDPLSEGTFQRLEQWLQRCDEEHHTTCATTTPPSSSLSSSAQQDRFPSRILEIGASEGDAIRLVRCADAWKKGREKYVALSHCWGKEPLYIATKANETALLDNVPLQDLNRTFQDAVVVCRRLGIRYLWIDSLCIVQDDPHDWACEVGKMQWVYGNAYFTISASRAASATEGFLQSRCGPTNCGWIDMMDTKGNVVYVQAELRDRSDSWDDEACHCGDDYIAQYEPISKRAWTLQERYLSRRKIFFCRDQIFWECQTTTSSEDGFDFSTSKFKIQDLWTKETGYQKWYQLVHEYSTCELTYQNDIFPAISGITRRVAELSPESKYCAGIWVDDLLQGLCWVVCTGYRSTSTGIVANNSTPKKQRHRPRKPSSYRAPSFSWASWCGAIDYERPFDSPHSKRSTLVHYISHHLEPSDIAVDPYGPYRSGWLKVRCYLLPVQKMYTRAHNEGIFDIVCSNGGSGTTSMSVFATLDDPADVEGGGIEDGIDEILSSMSPLDLRQNSKFDFESGSGTGAGTGVGVGAGSAVEERGLCDTTDMFILPLAKAWQYSDWYLTFLLVKRCQSSSQTQTSTTPSTNRRPTINTSPSPDSLVTTPSTTLSFTRLGFGHSSVAPPPSQDEFDIRKARKRRNSSFQRADGFSSFRREHVRLLERVLGDAEWKEVELI